MNILDFMKKSSRDVIPEELNASIAIEESADSVVNKNDDNESKNETPVKPLTITYGTGFPIDVVYGHMRKDYSDQGYNDAITSPDITFKDINKNIIQNKVLIVFKQVKLKYEVMITDIEQRVNACSEAGLVGTVQQLQRDKSVLLHHLDEVKLLEEKFRSGDVETISCLQTYEVGFLKGLAASAVGVK